MALYEPTRTLTEKQIKDLCYGAFREELAFQVSKYFLLEDIADYSIVLNFIESVRKFSFDISAERLKEMMDLGKKYDTELTPFDLPTCDIFQERYEEDIKTIMEKEKGVEIPDFPCRCGGTTYNIIREQKRALDEAMSILYICISCGKKHKIQ